MSLARGGSRSLWIALFAVVLAGCPVAENLDAGPRDAAGDVRADRVDGGGVDVAVDGTSEGGTCSAGQTSCSGVCADLQSDKNNCGSCGHACLATEACNGGMCGEPCPDGQTSCGGTCVDTNFTSTNCGRCGNACPSGQVCANGSCAAMCPTGRRGCSSGFGTVCADLQTDSANCGACGMACPSGQSCNAGSCGVMCPAGTTDCGGSCVDTTNDANHCGACPTACSGSQVCVASACVSSCATGQIRCGSSCVDPNSDAMNCGGCGSTCPSGQACRGGTCGMSCTSGQMLCGTTCIDVQTNAMNCGSCGNACPSGQNCQGGRCVCGAGQALCGAACVALQSDNANCGSCGNACPSGRTCTGGACVLSCTGGQMSCGGSCVDTQTDAANCGACGTACMGGQSCVAGACRCGTGQTLCSGTCVDTTNDPTHCGTCTRVCTAGQLCASGMCQMTAPPNDTRAGAIVIPFANGSSFTLMTNTSAATRDTNPPAGCASAVCTPSADVFYTFTLTRSELVYADTFGSAYDTVLFFTNSAGTPITSAGVTGGAACNDDSTFCTSAGLQSQVYARLDPGTYYLVVSGCGASGAATLHVQHLPVGGGTVSRLTTMGTNSYNGTTSGTGTITQSCGGAGPENTYWFITCPVFGGGQFSASTCGNATFDTVLDQRSAARSPTEVCNDDRCGQQSAITSTLPAGAGLHTVYVDGIGTSAGAYTLNVVFSGCANPSPIACMSGCENIQTDATNCGTCGNSCGGTATCSAGACVCPAGRTSCSNACVDLQSDEANCGACGATCTTTCNGGVCAPTNNTRSGARVITFGNAETTLTGTTRGATVDGPAACVTTPGPDVWYRFTLTAREVVYFDTAGSTYDTALIIANSTGALVTGLCNDDASCTTGGFTSFSQSRIATELDAGTYYVVVSGFNGASGDFTLHAQHLSTTIASFFYDAPISGGPTNTSTTLIGTSAASSATCGGTASGEDARWFVTCGAQQQFFSLCRSDTGATYTRAIGSTLYDPSLYMRSAQTGMDVTCNDDGMNMGATDCRGTNGATTTLIPEQFGSRINNVAAPRGINAVFVDERHGGSGMQYTLRYQVR